MHIMIYNYMNKMSPILYHLQQWFLHWLHQNLWENLLDCKLWTPIQVSDSPGVGQIPGISISNGFPKSADTVAFGTTALAQISRYLHTLSALTNTSLQRHSMYIALHSALSFRLAKLFNRYLVYRGTVFLTCTFFKGKKHLHEFFYYYFYLSYLELCWAECKTIYKVICPLLW